MNIDKTSSSSFIQSYQKQIKLSQVEKVKTLQNEDQLHISSKAKELFAKNSGVDLERQEKINSLKEKIQSGNYQVDSRKVADKVYQFWFGK